jgi:hypothetical protein
MRSCLKEKMSKISYKSNAPKRLKTPVLGVFEAFWGVFGAFWAFDAGPTSRAT